LTHRWVCNQGELVTLVHRLQQARISNLCGIERVIPGSRSEMSDPLLVGDSGGIPGVHIISISQDIYPAPEGPLVEPAGWPRHRLWRNGLAPWPSKWALVQIAGVLPKV
jgi:hypothetical protein